jgi:hypothetical protein
MMILLILLAEALTAMLIRQVKYKVVDYFASSVFGFW